MDSSAAISLHLAGLEQLGKGRLLDSGFDFEMGVHDLTVILLIKNNLIEIIIFLQLILI